VQTFNAITSAVFDVILAPFGHRAMWFDLLFWPILAGVVALLIYKLVSNQSGIADAKRRITVHLLEVRLYRDDLLGVLKSTALSLAHNGRYLGYNVLPMLVMIVPMTVILVQIVANYAYDPLKRGDVQLLEVDLAPGAGVSARDVTATFPEQIAVQDNDAGLFQKRPGAIRFGKFLIVSQYTTCGQLCFDLGLVQGTGSRAPRPSTETYFEALGGLRRMAARWRFSDKHTVFRVAGREGWPGHHPVWAHYQS